MNLNFERLEKYKLKNNLEVILYRDNDLPLVCLNMLYRVGSASEKKGKTGLTHLFEHMMFQGSVNVKKGEHFKYIQEAGGKLNGSTNFDRTDYYEKVPSNFLDLVLWLESDRMGFLLDAIDQDKLSNQIDVVKNERLERYDNQPYGLAWQILLSNLFNEKHPYHSPTIGWMEDILSYSLDDVKNFFKMYYKPSNASLVLAGDFESDEAKEKIQMYFGEFDGTNNTNDLVDIENKLIENKFIVHEDNVQLERLYLVWQSEKYFGESDALLQFLSDILTGSKNGRIYKKLLYEKQTAQSVSAFQFSGKHDGFFGIVVTAKPGVALTELKQDVFNSLKIIIEKGVTEIELNRTKNIIKSGFIYSLENLDSLAHQFNHYNFYLNEPNSFERELNRYQNVFSADIVSAAETILSKPYVELNIIPIKDSKL